MNPMIPRGRNKTTAITIRPKIEKRNSLKSRRYSSIRTTIIAPTTGPTRVPLPPASTMMIMVLAGGKGTLVGPVVGAIIVVLMEEYLRDFKELRFSIFGLIVMAVVLFLPRGIMAFIARRHETYVGGVTPNA